MSARPLIPVAQYLRMSTNHQQYSMANQRAAIGQYARSHDMVVVQTYSDPGRSGLQLKNRPGLCQLLKDVVSAPIFKAIVVYDVSRWGRFQDPDESAHYEFLCKNASVPVHYCVEQFGNSGTMGDHLLKQLKRTMAGEYSRELGVKVFAGQKRLIQIGHKMGGAAGFGLRRCVVSPDGTRRIIQKGQYKTLSTDWVILTPGPAREVNLVRQIYDLAAFAGLPPATIARRLNKQGVPGPAGRHWNHHTVTEILTNPKYAGVNVWGRMTSRLKSQPRPVKPSEWIVKENSFEPIIEKSKFDHVQKRLGRRTLHRTNEELLDDLKRLWKSKGRLSQPLVSQSKITPNYTAYVRRFGSLLKAYELIGYTQQRNCPSMLKERRYRNALRDQLAKTIRDEFPNHIQVVHIYNCRRPLILVDGMVPCGITICPALRTTHGHTRWLIRVRKSEKNHPMLFAALDRANTRIERLYLHPPTRRVCWYTRAEHDPWLKGGVRIKTYQQLVDLLLQIAKQHSLPGLCVVPKPL